MTAEGDEPGRGNAEVRITLHREEHDELVEALEEAHDCEMSWGANPAGRSFLAKQRIARELADVVYCAYGTAHAFAIDLDTALAEIHRANMDKFPDEQVERTTRFDPLGAADGPGDGSAYVEMNDDEWLLSRSAMEKDAMRRWLTPTPVCEVCGGVGFLSEPDGDKLQPCYSCRRPPHDELPA